MISPLHLLLLVLLSSLLIIHTLIIRLTHHLDSLPLYYLYHSSQWSKQRLYLLYGLRRIFKPPMPYHVMLMVSTRTCTQLDSSLHSFPLHFFFFESFKIICRAILLFFSLLFSLILSYSLSLSFFLILFRCVRHRC